MSKKHDAGVDGEDDLDETIERQMDTTGMTGVMRMLRQEEAAEDVATTLTATEDEEEEADAIKLALPPDVLP